jgi:hypothetical protein
MVSPRLKNIEESRVPMKGKIKQFREDDGGESFRQTINGEPNPDSILILNLIETGEMPVKRVGGKLCVDIDDLRQSQPCFGKYNRASLLTVVNNLKSKNKVMLKDPNNPAAEEGGGKFMFCFICFLLFLLH